MVWTTRSNGNRGTCGEDNPLSAFSNEDPMTGNTVLPPDPQHPEISQLSKLWGRLEGKVSANPPRSDLGEIVKRMREAVEELVEKSSPVLADRRL
jgi:hypothetical protein